jgi:uncharacterized protein YlxW (UPF0749 family)
MDEGNYPEEQTAYAAPKASPLPWVLFGLTVLLAAVIAVVLMIKVDAEKSRGIQVEHDFEEAKGRVSVQAEKIKELQAQIDTLQSDKAGLITERDALSSKLQATQGGAKGNPKAAAAAAPKKKGKAKRHH